jgi:protein SCO1/2
VGIVLISSLTAPAFGQRALSSSPSNPADQVLKQVRQEQKLNEQVPFDIWFRDESGKPVQFGQLLGRRPVLLNLIQYRCTMLCSEEMNVLSRSLQELKYTIGKEFDVITVSIDHREGSGLATAFQDGYVKKYGRPGAASGWHFLTGEKSSIRRLAEVIGYHFVYDRATDQFAHPDGVIVLTPGGKVSRYFLRLEYPARDIRFALFEAGEGRIGTWIDALALACFHYNPATGKYALAVLKLVQMGGIATVLALCVGLFVMSRQTRKRRGSADRLAGSGAQPS